MGGIDVDVYIFGLNYYHIKVNLIADLKIQMLTIHKMGRNEHLTIPNYSKQLKRVHESESKRKGRPNVTKQKEKKAKRF